MICEPGGKIEKPTTESDKIANGPLKDPNPNSLNGMKNRFFPNQNGNRKNERKNSLPIFDTVTEDNLPVFVPKLKSTRSIRKRSEKTGNQNGTIRDFLVPFSSLLMGKACARPASCGILSF
jgi:hypothetical protein